MPTRARAVHLELVHSLYQCTNGGVWFTTPKKGNLSVISAPENTSNQHILYKTSPAKQITAIS